MSVSLFVFQLKTFKCGYQCGIRQRRTCCWRLHMTFHQNSWTLNASRRLLVSPSWTMTFRCFVLV